MRYYTGIGSRETPKEVMDIFTSIATFLSRVGYILRSGHAKGSDQAFENGSDNTKTEIYLPWKGFEGSNSKLIVEDIKAFEIAETFHPYWNKLSQGAKKLQARNSHQALGLFLNTPSDFVICWTKNGKGSGGTGQCLRIAKHYNIPIFDFGKYKDIEEGKIELKKFLRENMVINNK